MRPKVGKAPDWRPAAEVVTAADKARARLAAVEIYERGERVTAAGYYVGATQVHAIRSLNAAERSIAVCYGAVIEELAGIGGGGEFGVYVSSGRSDGGSANLRRLELCELRDLARQAVPLERVALAPQRKARKAAGTAELGKVHTGAQPSGQVRDRRAPIGARVLLDMVCVDGETLAGVLKAHGWEVSGSAVHRLAMELGDVLRDVGTCWNGREARFTGGWSADKRG